jgi:cleavage and polyadenylation specificity factor subunit 2
LSLVLLSHSPSSYLSLYPYARAHWGLQCPVYATQPTVEMGRAVCLAEVESCRGEHAVAIDSKEHQDESEEAGSSNGEKRLDKGKKPLRGPFVATVEQVHEAFDWVKAIRYNQPLHLGGEFSLVRRRQGKADVDQRGAITSASHAIPVRAHLGWNPVQAPVANLGDSPIRPRDQSYRRKTSRWNGWR